MKKSALYLILFLLTSAVQIQAQHERTFNVSKGGTLELELNFGDVIIHTWNKNEVVIKGEDEETGNIQYVQSGNTIKVISDIPQDFNISIPEEFSLSIGSSGGDIAIKGNLIGKFSASTSAGSISFSDITGDMAVNSGGGDITGKNIKGKAAVNTAGGEISLGVVDGDMALNTAGGDIRIERMRKEASINTGGGNITLGTIDGKGTVKTGGGDIKIKAALAGIDLVTGGGSLMLSESKGDVYVVTGGGDIRVNNNSGNVTLKTGSGNVVAEIVPSTSGQSSIINGSGEVTLYIPENSKATVWVITKDKNSKMLEVHSDFTKTSREMKDNEAIDIYEINGGGSIIEVRNGFGSIEIRKKK